MRSSRRSPFAAGTTLIEVLVVIVVFAVGILAIVQIFPRGFQVLMRARDASVATNLARAEMERLKSRPEQLPFDIVAKRRIGNAVEIDRERSPSDLGPTGNVLDADGNLYLGGDLVGPWALNSGANVFRGILGEGGEVPAPTWVNGRFGGLRVLQFSPVSVDQAELVYGDDLIRRDGAPGENETRTSAEFFVTNPDGPNITLWLPAGQTERLFRVGVTAYVNSSTPNGFEVKNLILPSIVVPAANPIPGGNYPLFPVQLNTAVANLRGVEYGSIRVARQFRRVDPADGFSYVSGDLSKTPVEAYEYMVLNPSMGVLLFSPAPPEDRTPLIARVDYDVLDWRIIRDEFRVPEGPNPQHRLALGSLKVGGGTGPDGKPITPIWFSNTDTAANAISDPNADNFVVQDMITGGLIAEISNGTKRLTIDKSLGIITFYDADPSVPGIDGELLEPTATQTHTIPLANRPLRVLYMANREWSVQLFKAATVYTATNARPGSGEYYVGGSNSAVGGLRSRIYFAPADNGRRVTFDELYVVESSGTVRQLLGQTFQVAYGRIDDPNLSPPLPMIDVTSVVPGGSLYQGNSLPNGYAARGVKGASIAVRVLSNPTTFTLTNDNKTNMQHLEQWGRNWSRRTLETFIQRGDEVR